MANPAIEAFADSVIADARSCLPSGRIFEVRCKAPPHDCPVDADINAVLKATGISWFSTDDIQALPELERVSSSDAYAVDGQQFYLIGRFRA